MKLSQSNIGVKLSEIVGGDGNLSLKFTFPDFITGRFVIIITRESDNVLLYCSITDLLLVIVLLSKTFGEELDILILVMVCIFLN